MIVRFHVEDMDNAIAKLLGKENTGALMEPTAVTEAKAAWTSVQGV